MKFTTSLSSYRPSSLRLRRRNSNGIGPSSKALGALLTLMIVFCLLQFETIQLYIATAGNPKRDLPGLLQLGPSSVLSSYRLVNATIITPTTIVTKALSPKSAGKICVCELVSIDCLDSLDCLDVKDDEFTYDGAANGDRPSIEEARAAEQSLSYVLTEEQRIRVAMGIATRMAIKRSAEVTSSDVFMGKINGFMPPGKSTQYSAVRTWQQWSQQKTILARYTNPDKFINYTQFPECRANGTSHGRDRVGKSCYFHDWDAPEEFEAMEKLSWPFSNSSSSSNLPKYLSEEQRIAMLDLARSDVQAYRMAVKGRRMWKDIKPNRNSTKTSIAPISDLLAFAHILLIRFNRRSMVRSFYKSNLKTIPAKGPSSSKKPFPVSLHMRRADSCDHQKRTKYESQAALIDSGAQMSGKRKCYATQVYLDNLSRIETKTQRPLEVYLSTDYAGQVLEEIEKDHPDVFNRTTWKVVDIARDTFKYKRYIENAATQHTSLGESAYADLWHLSHGQAFIGHLGSRFGKISWYLATARYNTLIPFKTVDGHSVCCEIDEPCGAIKGYITSMENCMTFAHEVLGRFHDNYWGDGSMMRRKISKSTKLQHQLAESGGWLV